MDNGTPIRGTRDPRQWNGKKGKQSGEKRSPTTTNNLFAGMKNGERRKREGGGDSAYLSSHSLIMDHRCGERNQVSESNDLNTQLRKGREPEKKSVTR